MSSQPQAAKLAPELVKNVTNLARTLVAAARNWTLYPPEHPAVRVSFERLAQGIQDATKDAVFSVGITPDGLMIEGAPVPDSLVEAARLLHDRDLLRLTGEQGNPAFNQKLLKRFVNIVGLFPIGNVVRLNTEEVGVVAAEHPTDPFRPQVKIVFNEKGERLEEPFLANTWERDSRGEFPRAIIEAIDPDSIELDPLTVL